MKIFAVIRRGCRLEERVVNRTCTRESFEGMQDIEELRCHAR